MDHRDRRQGDDWRRHEHEDHDRPGGERPAEQPHFGRPGQAGYGESNYAVGRLSSSQGYGPQALGQGGHAIQNEGDFGYANFGPSGYGHGHGSSTGSRGQDHRTGQQDHRGGRDGGGSGGRGGADIGFGQGGAFQQGWGGQSDHQRREMGHGDHPNQPGSGGGTYGQGQYGAGSRRSEFRDEQRYTGGLHQDQDAPRGFAGHGASRGEPGGRAPDHDHEPDYLHYRRSRLEALDREHHERRTAHERELDEHYGQFREHKRTKFGREFEDWRSQQQGQRTEGTTGMTQGSSGGGTVGNLGTGSGKDRDEERDKSLSSPGSTSETDMSGVGGHGAAIGGGAGMKGAGAVGGSSDTMAAKTAGPGAPNPSSGADNSGVTTGSENKADKPH